MKLFDCLFKSSNDLIEIGTQYLFEKVSEILPEAMGKLGQCYSNGIGCTKDYSKAFECYTIAANAGNAEAQYDLGVCYRRGEGTPIDILHAIHWYEKAIAQGHTGAMVNCAILYNNGIGVETNHAQAYHLFKEAAVTQKMNEPLVSNKLLELANKIDYQES